MKVHLFYPQNDLALASGAAHFTAPRVAHDLKISGEALPLWYGAKGDTFITQGVNARWYDDIVKTFGLEVDIFDGDGQGKTPAPWGWSAASRQVFLDNGFDAEQLPDNSTIERLRDLSHRRTSRVISEKLKECVDFDIAPSAVEATDIEQVIQIIETHRDIVVKTPWSSSGRGIFDTVNMDRAELLRQTEGLIRRNGSVMVEKWLDRIEDFAMLFDSDRRSVKFTGYSLFTANGRGTYEGNILLSDQQIATRLAQNIDPAHLEAIKSALCTVLTEIICPTYEGPLGVDMAIARTYDGGAILAPVIEMNLRRTMGHVAHRLANDILGEGVTGTFKIVPRDKTVRTYTARDKRLISGTLDLVPPGGKYSFLVETDNH